MTATSIALVAAIVLSSAASAEVAVDFERHFVEGLESRQLTFERDADGMYRVQLDGRELTINTGNIRAEVLRDNDPAAIDRYLDHVMGARSELPEWSQAAPDLFPMIESVQLQLGPETVSIELTDRTKVVLAYYRQGAASVRFVRQADLETWGVTADEAWETARREFGKTVAQTRVDVLKAGNLALGMVHAVEPFKASMILSPRLKGQIPDELGWPVLAVAPARDFVYLLRVADKDAIGRVGGVVVREFRESGYPVSTEVWELSDEGARAIAEFPTD